MLGALTHLCMMKEALASCQLEGIGVGLTLEDLLIAEQEAKYRCRATTRKGTRCQNWHNGAGPYCTRHNKEGEHNAE